MLLSLISIGSVSQACSIFMSLFGSEVAHNVDWYPQLNQLQGLIILNPAGLLKTAELMGASGTPLVWTATRKSLTFTIGAADFPVSGFNDAGLTMGILMLSEESAAFPADPNPLKAVPATQFVQYNLDTATTVDEVIASTEMIRPSSKLKMHYFVCDKNRDCVIIQYVDGKVHTYKTRDLPVLTNSLYPTSVATYEKCKGINCDKSNLSLWRFDRLAYLRSQMKADQYFPTQAYSALNEVAQSTDFVTRFQLIYDARRSRMFIRRAGQQDVAWVHVDFKTVKPTKDRRAILIDADVKGNLRRWKPLTSEMQLKVSLLSGQPPAAAKIASEYMFKSVTCIDELTQKKTSI